jgi:hypothetical protein
MDFDKDGKATESTAPSTDTDATSSAMAIAMEAAKKNQSN